MSPIVKHDYASDLDGLAEALIGRGKWLEAEKTLREAIHVQEPLAAVLGECGGFLEDFALSLCQLGACCIFGSP